MNSINVATNKQAGTRIRESHESTVACGTVDDRRSGSVEVRRHQHAEEEGI